MGHPSKKPSKETKEDTHMRKLSFCFGSSRHAATWRPGEMLLDELLEKLNSPIRTPETSAQYHKMKKGERDGIKDKGGFVAGKLKGVRRKKTEVLSRSMITLDGDRLSPEFFEEYEKKHNCLSIVYTTHTHLPDAPRARLLMPLRRDVKPEEYNAIARYLAEEIGMERIDPCSFAVNQMMYWPTCSSDGEYICRVYEGDWLDPDAYLAAHPGWQDCTSLPIAPSEQAAMDRQRKKQEDPLTKEGIVGVFCRAYSIQAVMEKFLSDVYEPSAVEGRYDYIPGEGSSGVVVYDDKFAYSHHATDPAGGKLLNAFDLVRVHRFSDEDGKGGKDGKDEKKSFKAMMEFAAADETVQELGLAERRERASEEFKKLPDDTKLSEDMKRVKGYDDVKDDDVKDGNVKDDSWKKRLVRQKRSTQLENSLFNIKLIMQNDPYMKSIVFNQLADGLEIKGPVPWKHSGKFWRDADDAQLISYVDDNYGSFSQRNYDVAVTKVADDRSYHPIREYFASLPPWDGVKRVETLLIDYLGAQDNPYVRAVTKKSLCAAYMRVHNPGIKFDYIIVLNGAQGIGKSTLIAKLGMEWFSDSLSLSDMNDKTAAEKLQGYWILEIGEMAGMKKADIEKVKAFVSRQDDKYRASFGRRVTPHLRQCIFFGTTNSENGYLRDTTGNRRFWSVQVSGSGKYTAWELTEETVHQIWAETAVLAQAGEKLYLSPEMEDYAKDEQREAMELDEREGLVYEYLEMLLPYDWSNMDVCHRREYIREPNDPTRKVGTHKRSKVSNIEIWCECFGKPKEEMKPRDSYAIASIMAHLKGWKRVAEKKRIPIYGEQRLYSRIE